jgi:hypothetical protein
MIVHEAKCESTGRTLQLLLTATTFQDETNLRKLFNGLTDGNLDVLVHNATTDSVWRIKSSRSPPEDPSA